MSSNQNSSNQSTGIAPGGQARHEELVDGGSAPMPEGLTPHSLRRTFASVLHALGEDPGVVMDEMGHTDPSLVLRVYRQTMRRDDDEKTRLRALVEGGAMADSRLPGLAAESAHGNPAQ